MGNKETEYKQGPYKATHTRTIKINGPIEIVITEVDDSTHVPPAGGCGCGGGLDMSTIIQAMQAAASAGTTPPVVDTDPSA